MGSREDKKEACRGCPDSGPLPAVCRGLGLLRGRARMLASHGGCKHPCHTAVPTAQNPPKTTLCTATTPAQSAPPPPQGPDCELLRPSARAAPRPSSPCSCCPHPSAWAASFHLNCEASREGRNPPQTKHHFPGTLPRTSLHMGFLEGPPQHPRRHPCGGLTSKPPMTSRAWMLYLRMFSTIFSM